MINVKRKKGLSLAEVLISLLIMGVIIGATLPVFTLKPVGNSKFPHYWIGFNNNIYNSNLGNIGLNNQNPQYRVHFGNYYNSSQDNNVVMFGNAAATNEIIPGGPGTRLMWLAPYAAFRVGTVTGYQWDYIPYQFSASIGGLNNAANASYSAVVGGENNTVTISQSGILGGVYNYVTGWHGVAIGGSNNTISNSAVIAGSNSSTISSAAYSASILGGVNNIVNYFYGILLGGINNTINGDNSMVGSSSIIGGSNNTIQYGNASYVSTIINSRTSSTAGGFGAIVGCGTNCSLAPSKNSNAIAGGYNNNIYGYNSAIIGGHDNYSTGNWSLTGGTGMSSTFDGSFAFGNNAPTLGGGHATLFYYDYVYYTGAYTSSWSSDARLKTVIGPYSHGLNRVIELKPVNFTYKKKMGIKDNKKYIGLIAQNVNKELPEAQIAASIGKGYQTYRNDIVQYAIIKSIQDLNININNTAKNISNTELISQENEKKLNILEKKLNKLNLKTKHNNQHKNIFVLILKWIKLQYKSLFGVIK